MAIPRRIIPRYEVFGAVVVAKAQPGEPSCTRTIKLDGKRYQCGRSVRPFDREHDGIHDAFCEHGDGGSVRW